MRDALGSGRPFRTFNVIDDGSRESLVIEVDFSLPAERVVRVLEKIAGERGVPREIVVDNGPEFVSKALDLWAAQRGVTLRFIRPGKPRDNARIEAFNSIVQREGLSQHWFSSIEDTRMILDAWRKEHNEVRLHGRWGREIPARFRFGTSKNPSRIEARM